MRRPLHRGAIAPTPHAKGTVLRLRHTRSGRLRARGPGPRLALDGGRLLARGQRIAQSLAARSLATRSLATRSLATRSLATRSLATRSLGRRSLGRRSLGRRFLGRRDLLLHTRSDSRRIRDTRGYGGHRMRTLPGGCHLYINHYGRHSQQHSATNRCAQSPSCLDVGSVLH